jgi:negative regulator of sigma E activity
MKLTDLDKQDRSTATLDEEALSALLDGELSDFELRRLLRQVDQRPELLDTWQRLSLGHSALQGEPFRRASDDFSARLHQTIKEQAPLETRPRFAWLQPAGKLAVAASVTVAAFLGMQFVLIDSRDLMGGAEVADSHFRAPAEVDTDAQRRLNEYIQSVSIPARSDSQVLDFNILLHSPQVRPVSDRELVLPEEQR